MAAKFVIKKQSHGQFIFNLKAANGGIILTSELYQDKAGAISGVEAVRRCAAADKNYVRRLSVRGNPYFVLKSPNGQIIGTSEMYLFAQAGEDGIASVKANARTAKVEDLTVVFPPL